MAIVFHFRKNPGNDSCCYVNNIVSKYHCYEQEEHQRQSKKMKRYVIFQVVYVFQFFQKMKIT